MNSPAPAEPDRISFLEILVLLLSVLVLGSMVTDAVVDLPPEASRLLQLLDVCVCGVFLCEFAVRYRRAPHKGEFMKWGWIDLVASIPNVDFLRWGRLIRILRIIRILRGVRSFQKILALIFRNKIKNGLGAVLTTAGLLVLFSSIAILMAEAGPEANIKTAEDAVWWSFTTITTVGYGDRYPVTTEGRLIAMVLMAAGVGLFGTLSGLVASYFLGKPEEEREDLQPLLTEVQALRKEVAELRAELKAGSSGTG